MHNACTKSGTALFGTSSFTADNYRKYPDLQMYPTLVTALVPIYNLNSSQDPGHDPGQVPRGGAAPPHHGILPPPPKVRCVVPKAGKVMGGK